MSEIKVTPLLGVQDCNRSSTLVRIGGKRVLLDCGLNFSSNHEDDDNGDSLLPDFSFLTGSKAAHTTLDCVIISHYHLDHSGSLPYLTEKLGYKGPIYMTHPTKTIAPFVWRDCHKSLAERNFFPDFLTPSIINSCMDKVTTVVYSQVISVEDEMIVTVYPSNQPLGPDIFHIEVGQQSIFYTGGCNLKPSIQSPMKSPNHPTLPKARENNPSSSDKMISSPSSSPSSVNLSSQQSDLTVKMNGCILSFKIGHSIYHQQLTPQEVQLASAVFKNLQFMDEAHEDEFWQRIAYEMTVFSSPLNDNSKLKWKSLFYNSLRSCGQKSVTQAANDLDETRNVNSDRELDGFIDSVHSSGGKKKRKGKKSPTKSNVHWSTDDLIKFDSPEKAVISASSKKSTNKSNQHFNPDPSVLDEQYTIVAMFAERLKSNQLTPEFWKLLSSDLKKKGKPNIQPSYLEEYFNRLSKIQMEIMKSSENAFEAADKWPLFSLLNDLDLSYFFENKWTYRNEKKHFLVTSPSPNKKSPKCKKGKQKQHKPQDNHNHHYFHHHNQNHNQASSPPKDKFHEQQQTSEPPPIKNYVISPEDLADELITITLFANRLKKTEISPEFWTLLHQDFEAIGKPLQPEANINDHYKSLAEIQLDVMKTAENVITAVKQWPLFMMLHDLPLDIFLEDKWAYRRLKIKFN